MLVASNRGFLRFWVFAVLTCLIAIAAAACSPQDFKTQAAQTTQIVARMGSGPKTFNYAMNDSSPNIFGYTYTGLIETTGAGELEPGLAESWTISADKLKFVFTLRDALKWSDAKPLTADDVIFTFQDVYFNPKIPTNVRSIFAIGESRALPLIKKISDRQVEFTLPEAFSPFLRSIASSAILPAHALRSAVSENDPKGNPKFISTWGTGTNPNEIVVNGPYRIAAYNPNQRIIYERNPYYWRKDPQGRPLPYIERVVSQIVESADTALIQFRSGSLDVLDIGPTSFQLLKAGEKRGNFTIYNGGPSAGTSFIAFNLNQGKRNGKPLISPIKSSWFNTVEFRQAIAYGINRSAMINNIYRGLAEPLDSPVAIQSPYYLPPEKGLKAYDYNPEKAKELLKSAGFKYNAQGQVLDSKGNRVRFTINGNSGSRTVEALLSQMKGDLSKIGIQVDAQIIDFGTLVERITNSLDFDCVFLGFGNDVEPNSVANLWQPDGESHLFNQKPLTGTIEGRVIADWEAEIGTIFTQAAQEYDEPKRAALYARMQQIAQEKLPLIHLVNSLSFSAARNTVQGVELSPLSYEQTMWNVAKMQVIEDK
ncbi:ABC transporter substrate-binding protein [Myxacorys almedinensis]|uniref:ABC transporter substrate-binding protein n=1 Tax=Myxacorys almedinensis A TaxID=2690445 RepID=A0A8J7Z2F1_9CYAN|nr:ABC transporter substrate-binding protein [Myxacorys almedinensis]NDJ18040.1 ABC transporter substrate-binding protein [Myxacorys almedinensis A]